jgi:TonB family protein
MRISRLVPLVVLAAWLLFCAGGLRAQEPARVALVIGNSHYQKSPALKNPANDAADIAVKLQAVGFKLVGGGAHLNVGRMEMERLLQMFGNTAHEGETALFYYAGHGVAINGDNWLLPVDDSDIQVQEDVPHFALSSRGVVARMEERGGGTNILILDACRNNPLPDRRRSIAGTRGLARMADVPFGTFILYAASENQAAEDGDGRNGLFTGVLLKLIDQPGLRLEDIYYQTLDQVSRLSRNQQEPMAELKLTHAFYFTPATGSPAQPPPVPGGTPPAGQSTLTSGAAPLSRAVPLYKIHDADPQYPQAAMKDRLRGSVEVQFTVRPDGSTAEFAIISAQPAGIFEQSAIDAVRKWRYAPPTLPDGQQTQVRAQVRLNFAP